VDIKYGRKRSGIKNQLKETVNNWLSSITDENVRKAAHKDVIVTGGAIASMLLGEQVNDYDIYFKSAETTLMVAKYYVSKFKSGNPEVLLAIRAEKESMVNVKNETEERVIIFINSDGYIKETEKTDENKEKYRPVFMSQNAITLSNSVQLIIRFYGEPDKIHDNYDFVHAMSYWDHANEKLEIPAGTLESLLSRSLEYKGSLYPIASIFRMKKFIERGWRITAGQQLKIMWQISEIDLTDIEVVREQLTGVDLVYMEALINTLSNSKNESLTSEYAGKIIDRIFN